MKPFLKTLTHSATNAGSLTTEHQGLLQWLQHIFTSDRWVSSLEARGPPLLVYALKISLLDISGSVESSEIVCQALLAAMSHDADHVVAASDVQMWTDMYRARYGPAPGSGDAMEE